MSAAQRKAIDDHCTPEWSQKLYHLWYQQETELKEKIKASPEHTSYRITPAQLALWRKAAEPLHAEWREAVTKAGYNAAEVWSSLESALKSRDAMY
jgi:TRAP-type C4-dicarboxylate transport system substrate-binding protein